MGRRTYYFVAPLIPPALSSTQFFRPTHRITISKYLARGLRVRRSGVLPLCLGPNSVAERIIPPSEILGRQFVHDSLYSLSFFKVTRVTYYSPTSSSYQLLGCSSRFKNTPANIWPEATGVRRSGVLPLPPRAKFFHCQASSLPVFSLNVVAATLASCVSSLSFFSDYRTHCFS